MAEVSAEYDQNTLYANLKELILKDGERLLYIGLSVQMSGTMYSLR